jgi:hypothetical protein
MKYIEDKDGNGFMIYTEDEVVPPGTELLQFATEEEAGAFADRMLATPEGQARLQQILLEARAAGELSKPN